MISSVRRSRIIQTAGARQMLPEPAYNAIYLRLYYNLTMHRAALTGGRHGSQMSFGDLVAGTEGERPGGRSSSSGWILSCPGTGGGPGGAQLGHRRRAAGMCAARETMLRMYLLQVMFGLSDEGTEDAVLDSRAMQRFMHLDLMQERRCRTRRPSRSSAMSSRGRGLGRAILRDLDAQLGGGGMS